MRPIVFSDLDDTLFQTARKMAAAPSEDRMASMALNGKHSYTTRPQEGMIRWLLETTDFIPVTARTTEAFSRCRIPFQDIKICSHGAVILAPDDAPDQDWFHHCRDLAANVAPVMREMHARVNTVSRTGFRSWVAEEFGAGIYFCVKSNGHAADLDALDAELTEIAGVAFTRHRNDNNLSFIPAGISKRAAVEHVLDGLPMSQERMILGMGDSLTDLPFMELCQMMVFPRASQIHQVFSKEAAA